MSAKNGAAELDEDTLAALELYCELHDKCNDALERGAKMIDVMTAATAVLVVISDSLGMTREMFWDRMRVSFVTAPEVELSKRLWTEADLL